MNLTAAPLVRLTRLRTAPEAGTLVPGYHPLVLDLKSAHLYLEELLRLFQAMRETGGTAAPEKPRPYREYLAWLERVHARPFRPRAPPARRGARRRQCPALAARAAGGAHRATTPRLRLAGTGRASPPERRHHLGDAEEDVLEDLGRSLGLRPLFFADEDNGASDKYRLLMEAGKFADRHGFRAIWTPERHFHPHGGLYPNPSVLAAALSSVTENIQLRAGSVVLPLQSPFRVVEEWSIVDNLSRGRAGLSVVSGWVPNDFALAPENFARKRDILFKRLEQVERLWRGEAIPAKDGAGNEVHLRVFPRPVQPKLPLWVTCSTDPGLFEKTGTLGHHVLTSVIGQSLDEALEKLGLYGAALARAGHRREEHIASLMMHAFVGRDADEVLDKVRGPLTGYLRAHVALMQTLVKSLELRVDINEPRWLDYLASYAFERYYRTGALIGTVTSCLPMVDRLMASGVDEVACLIDFGVDVDSVLEGLTYLAELRRMVHDDALRMERVLTESLEERLPGRCPPVRFRLAESLSALR